MRYFRAEITYEIISTGNVAEQFSEILYCSSPDGFPKNEELRDLFDSLYGEEKKFLSAIWIQVRDEEIPTNEIHLL